MTVAFLPSNFMIVFKPDLNTYNENNPSSPKKNRYRISIIRVQTERRGIIDNAISVTILRYEEHFFLPTNRYATKEVKKRTAGGTRNAATASGRKSSSPGSEIEYKNLPPIPAAADNRERIPINNSAFVQYTGSLSLTFVQNSPGR